jgi:hypothetical protein
MSCRGYNMSSVLFSQQHAACVWLHEQAKVCEGWVLGQLGARPALQRVCLLSCWLPIRQVWRAWVPNLLDSCQVLRGVCHVAQAPARSPLHAIEVQCVPGCTPI